MATKTYVLGFLVLLVVSASLVTIMMNDVKIDVTKTKSVFYVQEGGVWVVSGEEWNYLYNGTKALAYNSTSTNIVSTADNVTKKATITRTTGYKNSSAQIIDTYSFDGTIDSKELFPIEHKIEVKNADGLEYRYQAKKLVYSGKTMTLNTTEMSFGRDMFVEWQPGYKSASISNSTKTLTIKYDVNSSDETYFIRLFDPVFNDTGYYATQYSSQRKMVQTKNGTTYVISAFYNTSNNGLFAYKFYPNGTFNSKINLTPPSAYYQYNPSVLMDRNDVIHVVYEDTTSDGYEDIAYLQWNTTNDSSLGNAVITPGNASNNESYMPDIAQLNNGTLGVAYAQENSTSYRLVRFKLCNANCLNASNWIGPANISTGGAAAASDGRLPDLETNGTNFSVVFLGHNSTISSYYITYYSEMINSTAWTFPATINLDVNSQSMGHSFIYYNGTPMIAAAVNNITSGITNLFISKRISGNWSSWVLAYSGSKSVTNMSLTYDGVSKFYLAFGATPDLISYSEENFSDANQSYNLYSTPWRGWTGVTSASDISQNINNSYINISDNSGSLTGVVWKALAQTVPTRVDFSIRTNNTVKYCYYYLYDTGPTSQPLYVRTYGGSGNNYFQFDGGSSTGNTNNTWNNISFRNINFTSDTYDMYINDLEIANGVGFGVASSYIGGVNLTSQATNSGYECLFDNLKIYNATPYTSTSVDTVMMINSSDGTTWGNVATISTNDIFKTLFKYPILQYQYGHEAEWDLSRAYTDTWANDFVPASNQLVYDSLLNGSNIRISSPVDQYNVTTMTFPLNFTFSAYLFNKTNDANATLLINGVSNQTLNLNATWTNPNTLSNPVTFIQNASNWTASCVVNITDNTSTNFTSDALIINVKALSPPNFTVKVEPVNNTYNIGRNWTFGMTIQDDYAVNDTWFKFNGTSYSTVAGSNNKYTVVVPANIYPAGTYTYIWFANDTDNNVANSTNSFTISKAQAVTNLSFNGVHGDAVFDKNSIINLSAVCSDCETSYIEIDENGTKLVNSSAKSTWVNKNYTTVGTYGLSAYYPATQNYSAGYDNHTLTVFNYTSTLLDGVGSNRTYEYATIANITSQISNVSAPTLNASTLVGFDIYILNYGLEYMQHVINENNTEVDLPLENYTAIKIFDGGFTNRYMEFIRDFTDDIVLTLPTYLEPLSAKLSLAGLQRRNPIVTFDGWDANDASYNYTYEINYTYYYAGFNNMTANTTPAPYVVNASSLNTTHGAYLLFDGNLTQQGATLAAAPQRISFDLGTGNNTRVNGYNLTSTWNSSRIYDWKNWTFLGSTNNINWTVLDTQSNVSFAGNNTTVQFNFSNENSYRYYMWNVTSYNNGSVGSMAEAKLLYNPDNFINLTITLHNNETLYSGSMSLSSPTISVINVSDCTGNRSTAIGPVPEIISFNSTGIENCTTFNGTKVYNVWISTHENNGTIQVSSPLFEFYDLGSYPTNLSIDTGNDRAIDVTINGEIQGSTVTNYGFSNATLSTVLQNPTHTTFNSTVFVTKMKTASYDTFELQMQINDYADSFIDDFSTNASFDNNTLSWNSFWEQVGNGQSGNTFIPGTLTSINITGTGGPITTVIPSSSAYNSVYAQTHYYLRTDSNAWVEVAMNNTYVLTSGTNISYKIYIESDGTHSSYVDWFKINGFGSYPQNLLIDVGDDGTYEVNTTGRIPASLRTINLGTTSFNNYACADATCQVPIRVVFLGIGNMTLSSVENAYNITDLDINVVPMQYATHNALLNTTSVTLVNESSDLKISDFTNVTVYVNLTKDVVVKNATMNITGLTRWQ